MNWWTALRALGLLLQLRGAVREPEFPVLLEDGYDDAEEPYVLDCGRAEPFDDEYSEW